MSLNLMPVVLGGILFPESWIHSDWYALLATFVAINTLMYASLAIVKMLPKWYPVDWWYRKRGVNRRKETRSIYIGGVPPTSPHPSRLPPRDD